MTRKALVLCMSDPSGNPRPNRIIKLLNNLDFDVDFFGPSISKTLAVKNQYICEYNRNSFIKKLFELQCNLLAGLFSKFGLFGIGEKIINFLYDFQVEKLNNVKYDVLMVENIQMLSMAFKYKFLNQKCKIIFDAREYYPKEFENKIFFKYILSDLMIGYCRTYLKKCDLLLTVSSGLKNEYADHFDVFMHVLRSTPNYVEMPINPIGNKYKMVHHGIANPDRQIENMIEIVKKLNDKYTLDFYLTGSNKYIKYLKTKADGCDRIKFNNPVPFDEIITMLNKYDIGLYYLEPKGFNVTYNLPNKFFEFIQARLAVVIGPSPEMKDLIIEYQCGVISDNFSFESMVNALQNLNSKTIMSAKFGSDLASRNLCFENESNEFKKYLEKIFY